MRSPIRRAGRFAISASRIAANATDGAIERYRRRARNRRAIEARPAPMPQPPDGVDVPPVAAARTELEAILQTNLVPFWYPNSISPDGGYRQLHGPGGWHDDGSRDLIAQARQAWFFARLARSPYGTDEHLAAARHGTEFLWNRMRDPIHSGFFWRIDALGRPIGKRVSRLGYDDARCKCMLGQAYALYALSEFGLASGEDRAVERATEVFATIETNGWDRRHGNFMEFVGPDWGRVPRGVRSFHDRNDPRHRTFGTQVHVLEALIPFVRLTADPRARTRLEETLAFVEEHMILRPVHIGSAVHDADGRAILGDVQTLHQYGHDLELVWLALDARATMGHPAVTLPDHLRGLVANALAAGEDRDAGGMHLLGPIGEAPSNPEKVWWVQAEAMLCMLTVHQLTGERADAAAFHRTLRWIVDHQVDWTGGDWHPVIEPDGTPRGHKADPWRTAYHAGRSVIECLHRLNP